MTLSTMFGILKLSRQRAFNGLVVAVSTVSWLFFLAPGQSVSGQEPTGTSDSSVSPVESARSAVKSSVEEDLRFEFKDASWPEVLTWFADQAGLALDMTEIPEGTFNYSDNESHSVKEAIDILNGYLLPRGVVLLRRDRFLVSIGTDDPNLPNMIPMVELEELSSRGDNELLRVAVPLSGFELGPVAEQLRGVLGANGVASPIDSSDSIVLQGFGKSLRTAVKLVKESVAPPSDENLTFRSFPLRHVAAGEAERQIQTLIGLGQSPFQASMRRRREYYDRRSRGRRDDDDHRDRASPNPLVANLAMNMKISSLRHTNSLLVTATPAGIDLVEQMLESIDVPPNTSPSDATGTAFAMGGPVLRVYTVDNADEDDVAETIEAVIPGVVINEDGRNNSIHIFATEEEHREVQTLISTIDSGGLGDGVEVISLSRSDPAQITDMLEELFDNEDRDDRPSISPGLRTRSIVVRGTSAQLAEIRKALASLGEGPDAENTFTTGSGPVRRLRIGDQSRAKRIANFIKEVINEDAKYQQTVRVIDADEPPSSLKRSQIIRRDPAQSLDFETPDQSEESNVEDAGSVSVEAPAWKDLQGLSVASLTASIAANPGSVDHSSLVTTRSDRRSSRAGADAQEQSPADSVTVEIEGDDILIYSDDEVALDEIERMVRDLVRQLPSRSKWNVFYLRAAPAEVTAQTLVDLLRANNFTETYLGVGPEYGMDSGVPTSMRIVPDARTNALFVSGPNDQVERAAEFIRYLDTTDLPASLRDRIPRTIELQYAEATDVAELIRELFKDLLVDPEAARRADRRRGRDEGDDRRDDVANVSATAANAPGLKPSGIQLTVAVDQRANELLVACNEQIFEQIKSIATERDQAAKQNQQVTRVLSVSPSIAPYLESLLPEQQSSEADDDARSENRRRREARDRRDD